MVETRIKSCVESGKEMVAEKPSVLHYKGASVYKHAQFKPIDTALSQLYGKERQIAKQAAVKKAIVTETSLDLSAIN